MGRSYGGSYTGTKAETLETDKGLPTAESTGSGPTAEVVEERRPAEGNLAQQTMRRTQSRERMQQALERVRQAAVKDKKLKFTTLLHHVYDIDRLREVYLGLKRKAAPGVDGETWQHYGEALESNLQALSERLRRGAYRAKPVRRVYIRKESGGQRPLGVPALEDKIVQEAMVEVLTAIYEVDFLGFSYGFRPKRGQHQALAALQEALGRDQEGTREVFADVFGPGDLLFSPVEWPNPGRKPRRLWRIEGSARFNLECDPTGNRTRDCAVRGRRPNR